MVGFNSLVEVNHRETAFEESGNDRERHLFGKSGSSRNRERNDKPALVFDPAAHLLKRLKVGMLEGFREWEGESRLPHKERL